MQNCIEPRTTNCVTNSVANRVANKELRFQSLNIDSERDTRVNAFHAQISWVNSFLNFHIFPFIRKIFQCKGFSTNQQNLLILVFDDFVKKQIFFFFFNVENHIEDKNRSRSIIFGSDDLKKFYSSKIFGKTFFQSRN